MKLERVKLIPQHRGKIRKVLLCLAFPSTFQGSEVTATPVQSPLDFSCIPATVLSVHACTYTQTQKLCLMGKALPGSGWGLGGGRTRPWELQDTGGKMSGAQQRCGEPRAETKAKTNPAGPQGATGPTGQSHQLHLGPGVLLDHCFFHGYQILSSLCWWITSQDGVLCFNLKCHLIQLKNYAEFMHIYLLLPDRKSVSRCSKRPHTKEAGRHEDGQDAIII